MSTFRTSFTAIAAAMLAVACGGGGGGGGDSGGGFVPPPPAEVLISATNQDTVARASITSIVLFVNAPVAPGAAQASAAAPRGGLTQLALRSVKSSAGTPAPAGMARALAQHEQTRPCRISGWEKRVFDDRDNDLAISAGDSFLISFDQCVDSVGLMADGSMGMVIGSYALTASMEDMSGSMTFQSLKLIDSSGSVAMNGGFSFHITATSKADGTELRGSFTVADVGLTVSQQGGSGGLSDMFTYRAGYTVTDHDFTGIPGIASWEVLSASGSFRSETLGGDLSLTTTTPFRSTYTDPTGDIYPTEGQLVVTGRNNTKLGLTATQTPQVRTDMCDDGDNEWESSQMSTWDSLLP